MPRVAPPFQRSRKVPPKPSGKVYANLIPTEEASRIVTIFHVRSKTKCCRAVKSLSRKTVIGLKENRGIVPLDEPSAEPAVLFVGNGNSAR
jgi:hypothetical protein